MSEHLTVTARFPVKRIIRSERANEYAHPVSNLENIGKRTVNALELARKERLMSVGFAPLGINSKYVDLSDVPKILEAVAKGMLPEFARHLGEKTTVQRIGLVLNVSEETFSALRKMADELLTDA